MASPVEVAVENYIRVFSERDEGKRAALIEASCAPDIRLIARSREFRGREAIADLANRFFADPNMLGIRVVARDAQGKTFRLRVLTDAREGSIPEVYDAGMIDDSGRIALILTFAGPLVDTV